LQDNSSSGAALADGVSGFIAERQLLHPAQSHLQDLTRRGNLGGHQLEMMYSQLVGWRLGEHNLVV
jgi:hypothetical protein